MRDDRSDVDRADPEARADVPQDDNAVDDRDAATAGSETSSSANAEQGDAPTTTKSKTSREPASVPVAGLGNPQAELPLGKLLREVSGDAANDTEAPTDPSGSDLGADTNAGGSPSFDAPARPRVIAAPSTDAADPSGIASTKTGTDAQAVELPRATHTATNADTRAGQQFFVASSVTPGADAVVKPNEVPPQRLTPAELPQFLQTLAVHVDAPAGSATIELEPLELGRLTVELTLRSEGGLRAEVRAERPDGYAAIEARLPELRASLIERGFANADIQLSLGLAQRESRREAPSAGPRRGRSDTNRLLETERVRALVPNGTGSVDIWA